jgi:hypothetical protein
MEPFMFEAPESFDAAAFASSLGAQWQPPRSLSRQGVSVDFHVVKSDSGEVHLWLSANWAWPWRWPAAGRLEADVLRALAEHGVRGGNEAGRQMLERRGGARSSQSQD